MPKRFAFASSNILFGLSSGDVQSLQRIAAGVVMIICCLIACHCAAPAPAPAPATSASSARQAWGHPRGARCSLRQDPRPARSRSTSPPIGSRGWSVSILVSSCQLRNSTLPFLITTLPDALCPLASLAWIGARLPGCEASPKHGDTREPAMAAAWSMAWHMSSGLEGR